MAVVFRSGRYYIAHRPYGKDGKYVFSPLALETTEEEARVINKKVIADLKQLREKKSSVISSGDTINDLWDNYLSYIETYKKPRTRDDVEDCGHNLKRLLGNVPLTSITPFHIQNYIARRKKEKGKIKDSKISNGTINKELIWFKGFLKYCQKNEIKTPDLVIEPLPYHPATPVILTIRECMALIDNLEPLYKAYVACLYLTGMRLSEVRLLKKSDIDFNGNIIYIQHSKTGKPRKLGIPVWLKEMLKQISKNNSQYVFVSKHTGRHIVNIRYALDKAAKKAGIEKHVHPHLLRHSISSHLNTLNVSTKNIQEFLGHTQLVTTQKYIQQLSEENVINTALVIDNMIEKGKVVKSCESDFVEG